MSNICLTPIPNLRCQSLSWLESVVLVIPPGLEVIFCMGLLVIKHSSRSRSHYLLAGEGIVYFILAAVDLSAHVMPDVRNSLAMFRAFDIAVGILATVPLSLFIAYLYIFTTRNLLQTLPRRFQAVVKYTLLLSIPVVLTSNLVGSFVSLHYRKFGHTIGVRFQDEGLRLFFSSLALVVFTTFQALIFCACFYRIIMALVNQKRIDAATSNDQEAHLFNGIGWMAAGIKLGAIESVIGFALGQFGVPLTRRVLHMIGRACLIIGVVKGLDTVEDFRMFDVNERAQRRSALLNIISGPVDSSFRQIGGYGYESTYEAPAAVQRSRTLSGVASNFSSVPSNPAARRAARESAMNTRTGQPALADNDADDDDDDVEKRPPSLASDRTMTPTLTIDTRNIKDGDGQRVIVRYRTGRAPTLEFTQLATVKQLQSLPTPISRRPSQRKSEYSFRPRRNSDSSLHSVATEASSGVPKSAFFPSSAYLERQQTEPLPMALTDSPLVRMGVGPSLPDRKHIKPQARRTLADGTELVDRSARKSSIILPRRTYDGGAPANQKQLALLHALAMRSVTGDQSSIKGYAASDEATLAETSSASVSREQSQRTVSSRTSLLRRASSRRKPVPAYDDLDSAAVDEAFALADDLAEREQDGEEKSTSTERRSFPGPFSAPGTKASFAGTRTARAQIDPRRFTSPERQEEPVVAQVKSAPGSKVEFAWARGSVGFAQEEIEELNEAWKEIGVQRVKSVGTIGSVTTWKTPTPSQSAYSRESMAVEQPSHENVDSVV